MLCIDVSTHSAHCHRCSCVGLLNIKFQQHTHTHKRIHVSVLYTTFSLNPAWLYQWHTHTHLCTSKEHSLSHNWQRWIQHTDTHTLSLMHTITQIICFFWCACDVHWSIQYHRMHTQSLNSTQIAWRALHTHSNSYARLKLVSLFYCFHYFGTFRIATGTHILFLFTQIISMVVQERKIYLKKFKFWFLVFAFFAFFVNFLKILIFSENDRISMNLWKIVEFFIAMATNAK